MTPDQFSALIHAIHRHAFLEIGAWVAVIITAIAAIATSGAAIFALVFAARQIGAARAGTRATFLVDLDRRWEGDEMKECRAKWLLMREKIIEKVESDHPNMTGEQKRRKRAENCSIHMHNLRIDEPQEYNDIISILGFFETMGYVADKGYISADEIVDLFGESLREFDTLCWDHIQKRIEESKHDAGVPTKLWEHACNLILHTRRVYGITR